MADNPIVVGGEYKESDDHIPNPTDMVAQFNTEGVGAHGHIEAISPIFEVDKVKTAQEIEAALDPENHAVPTSRVLLPEATTDNETAREEILAVAAARLDTGVVIGGPSPAEEQAALEDDEGNEAAIEQERSNAAGNSTGNLSAGTHEGDENTGSRTAGSRQRKGRKTSTEGEDSASKTHGGPTTGGPTTTG